MLKIKKEGDEISPKKTGLTPEYIQGKLFYFHDVAHKFHLDTKSFAIHEALDGLYKGLVDFKDEISEKLMGYANGQRIGRIAIDQIPAYSDKEAMNLVTEIKEFGYELYEWAGEKKYCDIENIAQSLSGLGAKTIFLLTLT